MPPPWGREACRTRQAPSLTLVELQDARDGLNAAILELQGDDIAAAVYAAHTAAGFAAEARDHLIEALPGRETV